MRQVVGNTWYKSPLRIQFLSLSNISVVLREAQRHTRMHAQSSKMQSENPEVTTCRSFVDLWKNYKNKKETLRVISWQVTVEIERLDWNCIRFVWQENYDYDLQGLLGRGTHAMTKYHTGQKFAPTNLLTPSVITVRNIISDNLF